MKKILLGLFTISSISAFSWVGQKSPEELSSEVKHRILKRVMSYVNQKAQGKIDEKERKELYRKLREEELKSYVESDAPNPLVTVGKKVYDNISRIKTLEDSFIESHENIVDNIELNKKDIKDINKEIVNIHNDIALVNADIYKNKEKISENKEYINQLVENDSRILEQFREMGTEVSRNQKELQHGVAMVAAMDAANLSAVNKGDLEIAGGVATYARKQAIAFGVAYAPINGLSLNLKAGFNFGKTNFWAASAGARYKFNLNK